MDGRYITPKLGSEYCIVDALANCIIATGITELKTAEMLRHALNPRLYKGMTDTEILSGILDHLLKYPNDLKWLTDALQVATMPGNLMGHEEILTAWLKSVERAAQC